MAKRAHARVSTSPTIDGHGGGGDGAWGDRGWPHLRGGRNNDAVSEKQIDFKSLGGETNESGLQAFPFTLLFFLLSLFFNLFIKQR